MKSVRKNIRENWPVIVIITAVILVLVMNFLSLNTTYNPTPITTTYDSSWASPSLFTDRTLTGENRTLVIYGQDLITHTSRYLGPNGQVGSISNGMNCQNCHLSGGKKTWGNNYGAVASTYPRFRDRSGSIETIYKRVSDCFERSLNGKAPDSLSKEYKAIEAYIKWVGKDVPKGVTPKQTGIYKLPYLDRAADPIKGSIVYQGQCQRCHGQNGEGVLAINETEYEYPPLWGENSYNNGAGLYRLSRFAGFVYSNMPNNEASHEHPVLSIEDSWDVAAFVNSRPRPIKNLEKDWPDISKKPIDHPFGPYTDGFSEVQHKYGPYPPILARREEMKKSK
jgi:thiosulfate dehydrogenase